MFCGWFLLPPLPKPRIIAYGSSNSCTGSVAVYGSSSWGGGLGERLSAPGTRSKMVQRGGASSIDLMHLIPKGIHMSRMRQFYRMLCNGVMRLKNQQDFFRPAALPWHVCTTIKAVYVIHFLAGIGTLYFKQWWDCGPSMRHAV